MMSEEMIIQHCAPTLAGLKTGSMFTCTYHSREELLHSVSMLNRRLRSKGLRIIPLRFTATRALIYVYRPKKLTSDLNDAAADTLLQQFGYRTGNCERCLATLIRRLRTQENFPHEIGLFLGYPPEDVCGFIQNRACDCKCVGCWKVYGDEAAARKKFDQYEKCTRVYRDRLLKGSDIERLTVAG